MGARKLEGRILRLQFPKDGFPEVQLDNGPVNVIHMATTLANYQTLLNEDLEEVHMHLMVRKQGRFRVKGGVT